MLTLKRFESLADSYGAELSRWPEESRSDAEALLICYAEARRMLDRARALDHVIAASRANSTRDDAAEAEAVARLRSAVATRLRVVPAPRRSSRLFAGLVRPSSGRALISGGALIGSDVNWIGLMTCSVVAIVAGVIMGLLCTHARAPGDVLSTFQPAPVQIFSDP